jgi:Lon protease-like protein
MAQPGDSGFLRLFPLQSTVLFPGMELPLVVFEPRYLQLTQECLEANEPFGVVLLSAGHEVGENTADPFKIGTTARIVSSGSAGQGRLSVNAVGGERFRALSFSNEYPYLSADVEYLADTTAEAVEPSLVERVKDDAISLVRAMTARRGGFSQDISLSNDPATLSYEIAQLFQGNAPVQQRLLERETLERLSEERSLLRTAMEQMARRSRREGPGPTFSPN